MPHSVDLRRLTARGRGAVAVIRVRIESGEAAERLNGCFVALNGIAPASVVVGRILYGHWGQEDVVVVRVAECEWEVHCHGGEAAVAAIIERLADEPCSATVTQEAVKPNYAQSLQSGLDEALLSVLLKCRTRQTAEIVLAQAQGVLRSFLKSLFDCDNDEEMTDLIQSALSWQKFADHLTRPWQIAVVGQPNAGKSSLLNAIVGYERSIVFYQPGTTRDRVEAEITLDGLPFLLADTAGIRESTDDIESSGVAEARLSIRNCDACLIVVDSTNGWTTADAALLSLVPPQCSAAILLNKIDLVKSPASVWELDTIGDTFVLETSALTAVGIDELLEWLPRTLAPQWPSLNQPLLLVPEIAASFKAFIDHPDSVALKQVLAVWV